MLRYYSSIPGVSFGFTRFLCPVVLLATYFSSSALQAEKPSEVARYTLYREKTPELAPSALQTEKPSEVARYTLHREKTPELAPSALQTGKPPEIEITEQSGVYQIKVVALIDVPARYVRHVLTDYRHIYRLNPSIIESEVLKQDDDGSVSVRTRVIGCAAYFCEELDRVEKVRLLPSGDIVAEIIPELSEFKSGQTLWRIKTLGEHCEVSYHSDMEPDIFIPPIVGKFLIKKSIRHELQISFANLEKNSRILAEREWQENYQPVTKVASYVPCNNAASTSFGVVE